jgi:hypothetical protein
VPFLLQTPVNKKKSFAEDDEGDASNDQDIRADGHGVNSSTVGDNDMPEEVAADNSEILKLKELHDKLVEGTTQKTKRRKVTPSKPGNDTADKELDVSVLESLPHEDDDETVEGEGSDSPDQHTGWKIDVKKSNSRKM